MPRSVRSTLSAALAVALLALGLPAHATGLVTISGTLAYVHGVTGAVVPVTQVPVRFSSGQTSASQTAFTNAQGRYTVTVPAGAGYTAAIEWSPSPSDPLPAYMSLYLQDLTLTSNTTFDITIPAAQRVQATITDQSGNPLPGATISLGIGSSFGSNTMPVIGGFTGSYTPLMGFGSARGYNPVRYAADAQGVATMWTLEFINPIQGYMQYESAAGYVLNGTFSFTPTSNVALSLTFNVPTNITVSGRVAYTATDGSAVGLGNVPMEFSSGSLGLTRTARTDSGGNYSVVLPTASDYSLSVEPVFAAGLPTPATARVYLTSLAFTSDQTLGITLPQATAVTVTVTDQNAQPLEGAQVWLQQGSSYGSSSLATISGYTGTYAQSFNFGSSYDDRRRISLSGAEGRATIYVYGFNNTMYGDVSHTTPAGTAIGGNFSFNPSIDPRASISLTVPTSVNLSGRIHFTRADGSRAPLANKSFTLSSASGGSKTISTDANGAYSTQVGRASDYQLSLSWLPGSSDPLPGSVSAILQNLDLTADRTLDITFPQAHRIEVRAVDAEGSPLTGSWVTFGEGSSYGTTSDLIIEGYTGPRTTLFGFGGGGNGYVKRHYVDASGTAVLWAFGFPRALDGLVTYQVAGGFTAFREFSFLPGTTQSVTVAYDNVVIAQSQGASDGHLSMFTPVGTSIEGFEITPSTANDLPDGSFDLTGILSYEVHGLSHGQTITVQFLLPEGIPPTDVFKVINDQLINIASISSISGRTVTLILRDGGAGDDDGEVNGVIKDPVMFLARGTAPGPSSPTTSSTASGSSSGTPAGSSSGAAVASGIGSTTAPSTPSASTSGSAETSTTNVATGGSSSSAGAGSAGTPPSAGATGSTTSATGSSGAGLVAPQEPQETALDTATGVRAIATSSGVRLVVRAGEDAAGDMATIWVKRPTQGSFTTLTRVRLNSAGVARIMRALPKGTVVRIKVAGRTVATTKVA